MKQIFTSAFFLIISMAAQSQVDFNTAFLSKVDWNEGGSNIWGFVDDNGTEYVAIGTTKSTKILSLEDPTAPILRYEVFGSNTIWRELKYFNKHIYVATDNAADGLTIIDVGMAPDSFSHNYWIPDLTIKGITGKLTKHHSLFIDEPNGLLYLNGHNLSSRGALICDLKPNPKEPIHIGEVDKIYCHDSYAKGDTFFSCDLAGGFAIWDVSDKSNPQEISRISTSSNFTHNAWISSDSKYIYTTDERANAYIDVYDITDLTHPKLTDKFRVQANEGTGVIPHNTHTLGNFAITSYYTDGFIVTDMTKPDNIVLVAQYDTYDGPHGGFNGCWGVYPYLPSGIIVASDIQTGLWVVKPEYKRACYVEGSAKIKDQSGNLFPIEGAKVSIEAAQVAYDNTNVEGIYKSGVGIAGTYNIVFNHPNFGTITQQATLEHGQTVIVDFLVDVKVINGTIKDAKTLNSIPGKIFVSESGSSTGIEISSNDNGEFSFLSREGIKYDILCTAWGYKSQILNGISISGGSIPTFILERGYEDFFNTNLGWTVDHQANGGEWEIGVPKPTFINGLPLNPDSDSNDDFGNKAYITGNNGSTPGDDDIDNGKTTLLSPIMDFTEYSKVDINLSRWFANAGGNSAPNDNIELSLSNGTDRITLELLSSQDAQWVNKIYTVRGNELTFTNKMQFSFTATDDDPGHVVEAGLDRFFVVGYNDTSTKDIENAITIRPTAIDQKAEIVASSSIVNINLLNVNGQRIDIRNQIHINNDFATIDASKLTPGIYILYITTKYGTKAQKVTKL